jgi:hypothetical protein
MMTRPRTHYILPAVLLSVLATLIFTDVGNAQDVQNETGTVRGADKLESLIISANGHGKMSSVVDERKITSAVVVLRQNGTVLITVTAELQLLAEGTWKATASSPEEIVLKITGGAVKGEVIGLGKLLLTSDRKSIKELTINVTSTDGQEISVTFVADNSEAQVKGHEREAPSRTWLGLEEGPLELCKPRCR